MSRPTSSSSRPTWRSRPDAAGRRGGWRSHAWPGGDGSRGRRGVALPGVLVLTTMLVAVTGWMVGHVLLDQQLHGMDTDDEGVGRVADAAADAVAMALRSVADWRTLPDIEVALSCPSATKALGAFDVGHEQLWVQAGTAAVSRWGPDTPQWHLVWQCHGEYVLGRWPGRGFVPQVAVWVADEPEGDGQPLDSGTDRLLIHAVARVGDGVRGTRTLTVSRAGVGTPVVLDATRGSTP